MKWPISVSDFFHRHFHSQIFGGTQELFRMTEEEVLSDLNYGREEE